MRDLPKIIIPTTSATTPTSSGLNAEQKLNKIILASASPSSTVSQVQQQENIDPALVGEKSKTELLVKPQSQNRVRDSLASEFTSSRPNSTASEGCFDTTSDDDEDNNGDSRLTRIIKSKFIDNVDRNVHDDDNDNLTTEASGSCRSSDDDEEDINDEEDDDDESSDSGDHIQHHNKKHKKHISSELNARKPVPPYDLDEDDDDDDDDCHNYKCKGALEPISEETSIKLKLNSDDDDDEESSHKNSYDDLSISNNNNSYYSINGSPSQRSLNSQERTSKSLTPTRTLSGSGATPTPRNSTITTTTSNWSSSDEETSAYHDKKSFLRSQSPSPDQENDQITLETSTSTTSSFKSLNMNGNKKKFHENKNLYQNYEDFYDDQLDDNDDDEDEDDRDIEEEEEDSTCCDDDFTWVRSSNDNINKTSTDNTDRVISPPINADTNNKKRLNKNFLMQQQQSQHQQDNNTCDNNKTDKKDKTSKKFNHHHQHHRDNGGGDNKSCLDYKSVASSIGNNLITPAGGSGVITTSTTTTTTPIAAASATTTTTSVSTGLASSSQSAQQPSQSSTTGKPPRHSGSLDRRRLPTTNRQERDAKSRSAHLLKEKNDYKEVLANSKGDSSSYHSDTTSYHHHNKQISAHHNHHQQQPSQHIVAQAQQSPASSHRGRGSPSSYWEAPPPPPIPPPHWIDHPYWLGGYVPSSLPPLHHLSASREELRMLEYHRQHQQQRHHDAYRYGSSGTLSVSSDLYLSGNGSNGNTNSNSNQQSLNNTNQSNSCSRYLPPPSPIPSSTQQQQQQQQQQSSQSSPCYYDHRYVHWNQRPDTDERVHRLKTDKESLTLQVQVLNEQIQAQNDKINDLERLLNDKIQLLNQAEDLLQRVRILATNVGYQIDKQKEMLSRSSLETQKLELMSAMSELKLQQAALERENLELRSTNLNHHNAQNNLMNSSPLTSAITPVRSFGGRPPVPPQSNINTKYQHGATLHSSHGNLNQQQNSTSSLSSTPKTPPSTYRRQIDLLQYGSLPRQTYPQLLQQTPPNNLNSNSTTQLSNQQQQQQNSGSAGVNNGNNPLTAQIDNNANIKQQRNVAFVFQQKALQGSSSVQQQQQQQQQLHHHQHHNQQQQHQLPTNTSSIANPHTTLLHNNVYHHQLLFYQPTAGSKNATLAAATTTSTTSLQTQQHQQQQYQLKNFQKQRGFSVPNLAETEKIIDDNSEFGRCYTPQPSPSPSMQKNKGFRAILGKIKRSNSGNLEDLTINSSPGCYDNNEFKRGGIRSTCGPRIDLNYCNNKPFKQWDCNQICLWFDNIGLDMYNEDIRKWLKNDGCGNDLINASPIDIEKELNLKSQLHRKKIILAINDITNLDQDECFKNAGKLDTTWVMRWLDDIGLPQHKDAFMLARVDGRVLHKLTIDDLITLHVTSCLHMASLRRGIQIMREYNWRPDCLIRRSIDTNEICDDVDQQQQHQRNNNHNVNLWTAHRVMEWLRLVDLAEYAPNLRGAGVHGALMHYETKFTAELLADLLSIPPSKTLLRRHLATHFKELLGRDVIQTKRDAETTLGYQPLIITSKIKTPKKSQFSLKRKKSIKGGDEWSDFVCPMGPSDDESDSTGHRSRVRGCLSSN